MNLTTKEREAGEKIIIAVDTPYLEYAVQLLIGLSEFGVTFKFGPQFIFSLFHQLFHPSGDSAHAHSILRKARSFFEMLEGNMILDMKSHDMPHTMKGFAESLFGFPMKFFTIHALAGKDAMREAVAHKGNSKILAVTLLSCHDESSVARTFVGRERRIVHVFELANNALQVGVDGLICAPKDLTLFQREREKIRFQNMLKVAHGTRPAWYAVADDQKNSLTPRETILAGADLLIVGRPITMAESPREATKKFVEEMAEVL